MDRPVFHIFPRIHEEHLDFFRRPAKGTREERHAQARSAVAEVFIRPQT